MSNSGNDAALGTATAPWKTLQHAADTVTAGDTVTVRAGTYAGLDLWTSGTATAPITFKADSGVVVNTRNQRTPDGINLEGASYVIIDGFQVINQPRAGIRVVGDNHVTIRNNITDHNSTWGIFTGFSDDLLIENNVASNSATQHGIYVSNSGDRPVVRNNQVWGNYGCGIQLNADGTVGGDGIITGAVIENNTIHDNGVGGGAAINLDGVQSSVIRNNLLYNNHAGGVVLYVFNGSGPSSDNLVDSNTIVMPADARWAVNIAVGSVRNTLLNNIIVTASSWKGTVEITTDSLPGFKSDYNAVSDLFTIDDNARPNLAQWRTTTGQDLHSFVATPATLFVSPSLNNYHLSPTSPALNVGTALSAPPTDLEGKPRPSGPGYDLGAYELQVSSVVDTTPPTSSIVGLSSVQTSKTFTLRATGSDPAPGSGIASYRFYASDLTAGTSYVLLATVLPTNPTASFTGQSSHTYGFRSIAVDAAGNTEVKGATVADATTTIPDLDPPVTNVTSAVVTDTTNGLITVSYQGADTGGATSHSLSYIDVFVQMDTGAYTKFAHLAAGVPNSSGVYSGSVTYHSASMGAHTYNFYSVGIDASNNVESAPSTPDASVTATFTPLLYTSLTVQGGLVERSFIRTVDVNFNLNGSIVTNLASAASSVRLTQYPLTWDGLSAGTVVARSTIQLSAIDHVLHFDFGQYGLGGVARGSSFNVYAAQMAAGDGYYEIAMDLNGDGIYQDSEKLNFYRLMGDLNGDHVVDQTDANILSVPNGRFVDVNGDGAINVFDNALLTRQKGKKLRDGLKLDA